MLAEMLPRGAVALRHTSERAQRQLESALELRIDVEQKAAALHVRVRTVNLTGHKLPTAYPSRRLWLHVLVRDTSGRAIFESGRWDTEAGDIAGLGPHIPHLQQIREPDRVMVYEAALADTNGRSTTSLLEAAGLTKDNRILPAGFDPQRPLPSGLSASAVTPVGVAGDSDFRPGSDQVEYVVALSDEVRPASVLVEAYSQSIAPGHLASMRGQKHSDIQRFLDLYRRHGEPVLVARQELLLESGRPVLVSRREDGP
jgi:hypothetical protein